MMAEVLLSRCSSYGIGPFNLLMMLFWDHCEISFIQFRDRKSRGSILRHSTRSFTSGLFRQFDLYLNYGGQSQGSDTTFRDLWLDLLALRGDISVMAPKDVERRPLRWSVGSWMRNDIVQYNLSFAFIRVYKPLYGDHV